MTILQAYYQRQYQYQLKLAVQLRAAGRLSQNKKGEYYGHINKTEQRVFKATGSYTLKR